MSWVRYRLRQLARAALRTILRLGAGRVFSTSSVIVAIAQESADSGEVAESTIPALQGLSPLSANLIVAQYLRGLLPFGYYGSDTECYWQVIEQRGLITPSSARIPRSALRQAKQLDLDIRFDVDHETIIRSCRRSQGTWINDALIEALLELRPHGLLMTIGAYQADQLVGGEFGVNIGGWYLSMSTFHDLPGAGSVLFARIVHEVMVGGRFAVCDTGEMKDHSARFGAVATNVEQFSGALLDHLGQLQLRPTTSGLTVELPQ
jgi:leucyl/phenylalanyl-tRNA--protein transferase